jgi:RNA polymerase sigma factor (TIGR02999 family)
MSLDSLETERLFAGLYHELHRMAQRALRRDGRLLTISATTLLHESYLSISKPDFSDAQRFLSYTARTMRGLIIDEIRRRRALKSGAAFTMISLGSNHAEPATNEQDLIEIDAALKTLAAQEPALAELVELRYFCGLSLAEIAALRSVTLRTAQRQWEKARLMLFNLLTPSSGEPVCRLDQARQARGVR